MNQTKKNPAQDRAHCYVPGSVLLSWPSTKACARVVPSNTTQLLLLHRGSEGTWAVNDSLACQCSVDLPATHGCKASIVQLPKSNMLAGQTQFGAR